MGQRLNRDETAGASQIQALNAMVRALSVLKQAKKRGVDVKPYRRRLNEARRLFQAGDYREIIERMEQLVAEVTGTAQPPS